MDSIANLIIKIKNAGKAGHDTVSVPFSKVNLAIAELLKKHGYIGEIEKRGKKVIKTLDITVAYEGGKPKINEVERVSKLSRRMYEKAKDIKPVRQGFGMAVLTTPKGVLTDMEAKKAGVGGEILFKIW